MKIAEHELVDAFRSSLPDVHNREMWVNETFLEYRRLRLLRADGFSLTPAEGSLMEQLLQLEVADDREWQEGRQAYEQRFGHTPTYCWTMAITDLYLRLASGSSSPGTAWMSNDA